MSETSTSCLSKSRREVSGIPKAKRCTAPSLQCVITTPPKRRSTQQLLPASWTTCLLDSILAYSATDRSVSSHQGAVPLTIYDDGSLVAVSPTLCSVRRVTCAAPIEGCCLAQLAKSAPVQIKRCAAVLPHLPEFSQRVSAVMLQRNRPEVDTVEIEISFFEIYLVRAMCRPCCLCRSAVELKWKASRLRVTIVWVVAGRDLRSASLR